MFAQAESRCKCPGSCQIQTTPSFVSILYLPPYGSRLGHAHTYTSLWRLGRLQRPFHRLRLIQPYILFFFVTLLYSSICLFSPRNHVLPQCNYLVKSPLVQSKNMHSNKTTIAHPSIPSLTNQSTWLRSHPLIPTLFTSFSFSSSVFSSVAPLFFFVFFFFFFRVPLFPRRRIPPTYFSTPLLTDTQLAYIRAELLPRPAVNPGRVIAADGDFGDREVIDRLVVEVEDPLCGCAEVRLCRGPKYVTTWSAT